MPQGNGVQPSSMLADIADSQVAPREREESVTGDAAASAEPELKSAEAIVPSMSGGDVRSCHGPTASPGPRCSGGGRSASPQAPRPRRERCLCRPSGHAGLYKALEHC